MELVLAAAAAVALSAYARLHPVASGPLDTYTTWLLRQQKPALHR